MPRVVFMCGPAGAGKSTTASQFERSGMVRLSFDQEAGSRGYRSMPLPDHSHRDIETHLRRRLIDLVGTGHDVVLDFSFWSRAMRDDWRALLTPRGIVAETIYLATPRQTCLDRIALRASDHADGFVITPELAARYFDHFEPPTVEEGPLTILG